MSYPNLQRKGEALKGRDRALELYLEEHPKMRRIDRVNKRQKEEADDYSLEAWRLKRIGYGPIEIAQRLGICTKTVRRHLDRARKLIKHDFDTEYCVALERADLLFKVVLPALVKLADRIGTDQEKSQDGLSIGRITEALTGVEQHGAKLKGSNKPTKIVEEQTRRSLDVLIHTTDKGLPMLTWDRSFMAKPAGPVPGLTIFEGCRNNGNTEQAKLQDSAPN